AKNENPDLILISHTLPGKEDIKNVITKLTSKDFNNLRIVYLYGEDDSERKQFIDFLISRGVYDYQIGDLTPEALDTLLFKPKSREDVKSDIIDSFKGTDESLQEDVSSKKEKLNIKTQTIYRPLTLKQKVISFIGPNGSGKTTTAINIGLTFAEGLKETSIILIDFDFKKPDIAYHLDIVDSDR
ncbi:hypothetical protein, partial [Methanosarcina mazei]